ncbi:Protein phosphatase 2C 29 [Hibiscus syriacus]|uniref:Protein phosphatase 2C 29 n=1 Tax=Hibiscus syriacus TaxID=106335 RepID=A0A6A3B9V4_HIBSY|nr:protein phosphatase 2C 29-like [Hibiscus syriacus]KAE8712757.1 Protein phosphatase 2C 29 [Hibiscus syriacus]
MGSGVSTLCPCFNPVTERSNRPPENHADLIFTASEPLDETLGHSFCYVRSSNRFLSPTTSDRFVSPSHSLRFSPSHDPKTRTGPETLFKAISGASVSANTSTPRTVLQLDNIYDEATENTLGYGVKSSIVSGNGFEGTSSFCALPLQPVPRGGAHDPVERGGFFMSGPLERGAVSGPLEANPGPEGGVHFSAPLGGIYIKKKRKNSISGIFRNFSEKKRPWVVPVLNFVGKRENSGVTEAASAAEEKTGGDLQWALGKAGEDRVHVVVSEEQGWLFVGIYDGFNGPDAPEFLMGNLYRAVFHELHGLFWELDEDSENKTENEKENEAENKTNQPSILIATCSLNKTDSETENQNISIEEAESAGQGLIEENESRGVVQERVRKVTFEPVGTEIRRRRLWEFLAEDDPEDGLDLSGSDRFAFSVDDAITVSKEGSAVSRRWLLLSKLRQGLSKHREDSGSSLFPWRFRLQEKEKVEEVGSRVEERIQKTGRKRKEGPVDPELVLGALSRALEMTELAYLDMTDKVLDTNPELALMGSCLLVVLMRDADVYVMNVGDSRAIVSQYEPEDVGTCMEERKHGENGSSVEVIVEETLAPAEKAVKPVNEAPPQSMRLTALQLSTDHSTSIGEEIIRIKNEHPDDSQCFVNDRLKGRLKVTRAFGAGFLKKPKLNDALLEMFRNEYIGTAPYLSCSPSLRHHRLCPRDQFLILSSDGLYQYLSNQEVVSLVESFMEKFPDGDPAQHLIEEVLMHAAKKAGMDFHELLDIPTGDRRKYHDDVTVMVISLEGRIWKSSGKYV